MSEADIELLRRSTDMHVRIIAVDGERMLVKLVFVDDEYSDIIVDILKTDRPDRYKKPLNSAACTIAYADIASFEPEDERC